MNEHDEYYEWLMDIIDGPGKYSKVLRRMWKTEFYAIVENDNNRAADGIELRYHYEYVTGENCNKEGACTLLEMIVGVARRVENDFLYDPEYDDRTYIWFWEMFYNLGLGDYDDMQYNDVKVRDIIEDFLDRRVVKGEIRSLFPSKWDKNKWPEMEIWRQMSIYILEKYG